MYKTPLIYLFINRSAPFGETDIYLAIYRDSLKKTTA